MGMKRRKGHRAAKVQIPRRTSGPGEVGADPCGGTWDLWVAYSPQMASYVAVGADVTLYPKDGKVFVMIGTREIGTLAHPAVPQIVDCMDLGYIFAGSVVDIEEEASRALVSVSGARTDERQ